MANIEPILYPYVRFAPSSL